MKRTSTLIAIAFLGTAATAACSSFPSYGTVTAEQAAAKVGLSQFIDCGPGSHLTSITDTGNGYLGGKRIQIVTFTTTAARDNWLQTTGASFNITPTTYGPTWIAFVSANQSGKGC